MRRVKLFLKNILLPGLLVMLLYWICRPIYMVEGEVNLLRLCLCIGVPFGIKRMLIWFVPFNYDLGGTCGILFLDILVGAVIGLFALVYTFVRGIYLVIKG